MTPPRLVFPAKAGTQEATGISLALGLRFRGGDKEKMAAAA